MISYYLIAFFFVWIPCGLLSGALAKAQNASPWLWILAGSSFGPIGLAGAMLLKEKK
tara:strand:+ start:97 stop:267 length:171 start_codon:yes stop_codon:yes gene_type:complete